MSSSTPQDQSLWREVDNTFGPLSDAVEAAANVLEVFGEGAEDPGPQAAIIGPKLREIRKEVYDQVLALCGHRAQPATRDVKKKGPRTASDLENEMEKILLPLGVAVDAAGELLRHEGYQKDRLAPQVAEIVGNAASESFEVAYRNLIELARITVGDDAPVPAVGRQGGS